MKRILIIDDDSDSVAGVKAEIEERIPDAFIHVRDFSNAVESVSSFCPQVVILDLMRGNPAEGDDPGRALFDDIWNTKHCPTIIHSARAEDYQDRFQDDPFVKIVTKGSGADVKVVEFLDEFREAIDSLGTVEGWLHNALNQFLVHGRKEFFSQGAEKPGLVERAAIRHVAASIDEPSDQAQELQPWECYVFPPIPESNLFLGDLVKLRGAANDDPSGYYVVLTPSCDLEPRGKDGIPNVSNVLLAKCAPIEAFLKACNLDEAGASKAKKRIPPFLRQGFYQNILPLPGFPERWPELAADFRELALVDFNSIGHGDMNTDGEYVRIASLDSPFRELVSWAYIQYAARPGLPTRDAVEWANKILN